MDWYQVKVALATAVGVSHDALHVLLGVLAQVVLALLLGRRLSHPLPWLVVLMAALLNEWSDFRLELWPDQAAQWGESLKDMLVTMLLPTLLLLLARYHPRLFDDRCVVVTGPPPIGPAAEEPHDKPEAPPTLHV